MLRLLLFQPNTRAAAILGDEHNARRVKRSDDSALINIIKGFGPARFKRSDGVDWHPGGIRQIHRGPARKGASSFCQF